MTTSRRFLAATCAFACAVALGTSSPRELHAEPQQASSSADGHAQAKTTPPEPVNVADLPSAEPAGDVELADRWIGFARGCSYLPPKGDFVGADGSVDVVFEFHAGMMVEKEMRETGLRAVFVTCGFGVGSGSYADELTDRARFGRMLDGVVKKIATAEKRSDVHVRRLTLASWSAGFGAVSRILAVSRYYDMVDTVVLLDGLHSKYKDPNPKTPAQGKQRVELRMMASFLRFAKDAADGKKTMVVTHSAIVPPDYASAAEATAAMLDAIGVPLAAVSETTARGMTLSTRADAGGLHVRGFRGGGPRDHFAHLHLFGEVLRSWVVPRWKREDPLVYTLAGEQR